MSQRYDPKALIYVNEKDEPYRLRLKPEKLLTAAYEFQKVQNEMESLPRLQVDLPHLHNDPIAGCPVCARTFRAETNSGEEAEEEEAAAAVAAGSAPTCATQLHCSRTTAGAHAKLDYHGIVGLVCMHIIPLLGLFLAMPTYEQHYYYDVLFESLLTRRPDVAFLYLDLACRYIGRFNRLLAKLPESSRNKFAGARVGEQTEQLWSLTKKFCKLARYMSRMRWIDGFNFLLQQYTKALADLVAAAARQGINNLPAMAEEEAAPVAQRLLLGPKATDQKKRLRLEAEKNKAAIDAGLGVTERDWEPGSATYEEGLRELRVSKLTHYERQIEETVFERRLVLQRMEQTGGDKNGAQDRKKAEQLRKRIEENLAVHASWAVYPELADGAASNVDVVDSVCHGEFPWASGHSLTAAEHYLPRYRTAKAHVDRYTEELGYLQKEAIRAVSWVEEQTEAVQQRLQQLGEGGERSTQGQIPLLRRRADMLDCMAADLSAMAFRNTV
ncbi:hypothetical protein C2E20_9052 [Micractinium conductrix]|uniref:Uncharacterized protein n=1 Tax=Micractinium conductrix TaxID=554055 RepID=A0A2P6UZL1_9CHLO|nr:hypothetical protein C2E20_9052 [Micractinium conductrix]|eukprot:PSC67275.1 hypothetical protein C2E20_9052 [Micractinium conductrix]